MFAPGNKLFFGYMWWGAPKGFLSLQEQNQSELESLRRERGELEEQLKKERCTCQGYLVGARGYLKEIYLGRVGKN